MDPINISRGVNCNTLLKYTKANKTNGNKNYLVGMHACTHVCICVHM